jgi:hypothetical protein
MHSTMHLYANDGAAQRVGRNETAFSTADANWAGSHRGRRSRSGKAEPSPSGARAISMPCIAYSAGGAYVNFMMDEGQERVQASFRDNYDRLARIKSKYDPTNLFRVNQNIRPAASSRSDATRSGSGSRSVRGGRGFSRHHSFRCARKSWRHREPGTGTERNQNAPVVAAQGTRAATTGTCQTP